MSILCTCCAHDEAAMISIDVRSLDMPFMYHGACLARQKSRMLETDAFLTLLTKWQWQMLLNDGMTLCGNRGTPT